jgi:hypothetical protein
VLINLLHFLAIALWYDRSYSNWSVSRIAFKFAKAICITTVCLGVSFLGIYLVARYLENGALLSAFYQDWGMHMSVLYKVKLLTFLALSGTVVVISTSTILVMGIILICACVCLVFLSVRQTYRAFMYLIKVWRSVSRRKPCKNCFHFRSGPHLGNQNVCLLTCGPVDPESNCYEYDERKGQ